MKACPPTIYLWCARERGLMFIVSAPSGRIPAWWWRVVGTWITGWIGIETTSPPIRRKWALLATKDAGLVGSCEEGGEVGIKKRKDESVGGSHVCPQICAGVSILPQSGILAEISSPWMWEGCLIVSFWIQSCRRRESNSYNLSEAIWSSGLNLSSVG